MSKKTIIYQAGDNMPATKACIDDFFESIASKRLWLEAAWRDIHLRYINSKLGPLWITISMGIFIACFSVIGTTLFSINIKDYLPYLAVGIVTWAFISSTLIEGSNIFIGDSHIILSQRVPYFVFVLKLLMKNLFIFFHNILIFIFIAIIFKLSIYKAIFISLLALLILAVFLIGQVLILAIISTRYRDIPLLLASLVQVCFFLTPVMWNPDIITKTSERYIVDINPLHHFLVIIRNPLLQQPVEMSNWIISICTALISIIAGWVVFSRYRRRISCWL